MSIGFPSCSYMPIKFFYWHMIKMRRQFRLYYHYVLNAYRPTLCELTNTHLRNISDDYDGVVAKVSTAPSVYCSVDIRDKRLKRCVLFGGII